MDAMFGLGLAIVAVAALGALMVLRGSLELRPFRTSAIIFGVGLLTALGMVLGFVELTGYAGGLVDGTLIGVVFTAFATAITRLCDDAGDSDVVKITEAFLEHELLQAHERELACVEKRE